MAQTGAAGAPARGKGHAYPFFTNRACPYFPCHEGADPADFNCLFCYCPLYALGDACGGDFAYLENGAKDCSGCARPHEGDAGTQLVMEKFPQIAALAARRSEYGARDAARGSAS